MTRPDKLTIALVQQNAGTDPAENLERGLAATRRAAEAGAGLVAFAELAFSRFHPQLMPDGNPLGLAEPVPGPTTEAFCRLAKELSLVVVLNLYESDGDLAFDSSPVIDADGRLLGCTRMLHITDYPHFHEQAYYAPGDTGMPVYDTAAGRIGVAICYDRHYPEVMRALGVGGAELVLVPQAGAVGEWPEGLFEAEMRVASFQNGYYSALCNRTGAESELRFAGQSFVCAPDGTVVARAPADRDHLLLTELDLSAVERSHARRLFMRDRRPELYPAWIGFKED
jgi:beta-ureidopropionase